MKKVRWKINERKPRWKKKYIENGEGMKTKDIERQVLTGWILTRDNEQIKR